MGHGAKFVVHTLIGKPAPAPAWSVAITLCPSYLHDDAVNNKVRDLHPNRKGPPALDAPTDLGTDAVQSISAKLNEVLADVFALYLKTKNFHWHISGPHFRDYHLLLDGQSEQIFAATDEIAERVRKIGGFTLRSIRHVARLRSIKDNDEDFVPALDMPRELMRDNKAPVAGVVGVC